MSDIIAQIEFSRHICVCLSETDTNDDYFNQSLNLEDPEWRVLLSRSSLSLVSEIAYHATTLGVRKQIYKNKLMFRLPIRTQWCRTITREISRSFLLVRGRHAAAVSCAIMIIIIIIAVVGGSIRSGAVARFFHAVAIGWRCCWTYHSHTRAHIHTFYVAHKRSRPTDRDAILWLNPARR